MVGGLDHIEVVLDHNDGVALINQLLQHVEQFPRVLEVQTGRRLVQYVDRAARAPARQLLGQLHTLGLATGQRGRRLPEHDIPQPDRLQRTKLGRDLRQILEQRHRLVDGQLEYIGDGGAAIPDLERLPVVAPTPALLTGHVHVGQEMHLDRNDPATLACFAPAAFDVEREPARSIPTGPRGGQHCEQLADKGEQSRVGRGVRARCAPNRRLVDLDHLVHEIGTVDATMGPGGLRRPIEIPCQRPIQDVVDEGRFPRTADPGNGSQHAEWNSDVDVLEIVRARAADDQFALQGRAAGRRGGDHALPPQIAAGQRAVSVGQQLRRGALEDHFATMLGGAGAQVDHVV